MPWFSALSAVGNPVVVRSIRNGLVMAIPIVLIGSFALVLQSLPLPAYQAFLEHFASGMLRDILSLVFGATSGILSVYMAVFIGMSHARLQRGVEMHSFGFPIVCNVYLFLPFTRIPLLVFLISYGAMALGVVSLPIREVGWTTPITEPERRLPLPHMLTCRWWRILPR